MAKRNVAVGAQQTGSPGIGIGSFFASGTTLEEKKRQNARNPRFATGRAIGFTGTGNLGGATESPGVAAPAIPFSRAAPQANINAGVEAGDPAPPSDFGFGEQFFDDGLAGMSGWFDGDRQANFDLSDVFGGMNAPSRGEWIIENINPGAVSKGVDENTSTPFDTPGVAAIMDAAPGSISMGVPDNADPFDFGGGPSPGDSFDSGTNAESGYEGAPGGGMEVGGGTSEGGYEAAAGGAGSDPGGYGEAGEAGGEAGGGGGCWLTEAVAASGGQGDNAPELQVLRSFRDQVMMTNPVGQTLVQQYEALAPIVVEGISARPDAIQIFQEIKAKFIDQAVAAIQSGHTEEALQIYSAMIAYVTPIAIEAVTGQGGESDDRVAPGQEDLDLFGTEAALLEHSPEMRMQATGNQQFPTAMEGQPGGGMPMQQPGGAMAQMFAPAAANPPPRPAPAQMRRF